VFLGNRLIIALSVALPYGSNRGALVKGTDAGKAFDTSFTLAPSCISSLTGKSAHPRSVLFFVSMLTHTVLPARATFEHITVTSGDGPPVVRTTANPISTNTRPPANARCHFFMSPSCSAAKALDQKQKRVPLLRISPDCRSHRTLLTALRLSPGRFANGHLSVETALMRSNTGSLLRGMEPFLTDSTNNNLCPAHLQTSSSSQLCQSGI